MIINYCDNNLLIIKITIYDINLIAVDFTLSVAHQTSVKYLSVYDIRYIGLELFGRKLNKFHFLSEISFYLQE